jgi:Ca-activated chloride channel family protein
MFIFQRNSLKVTSALFLLFAFLIGSNTAFAARCDLNGPSDCLEPGQLDARTSDGEKLGLFPLQHTRVDADVSGFVTRVTVTQFYENPFQKSIEAIYTFPLPEDAAVDKMEMIIGDRTINGLIKRKEEAQKIYNQARDNGQTASLLTQERPNIFTQAVANIHPGDKIRVQISYVQVLKYEAGQYTFRFPMVVGPRYVPGVPLKQAQSGTGFLPDTSVVPDASRISPPVLPEGTRSGHDISIHVNVDAGIPVHKVNSPSHKVILTRESKSSLSLLLDPSDSIPNKDFVVHYKVAGDAPELAVLATADPERGGHFMFMVQPKADFDLSEITAKEMFFVVDNSGSMNGQPMEASKALVRKAIREMNPNDTFQILRFSENASGMAQRPLANTPENVKRGLQYIDRMRGMGGTNMIEGIKAALDAPRDPKRIRIVLFLTDGYIGNDTQILAAVKDKIGNARLFSVGVGSSPNTHLLNKMAWHGRGAVDYLRHDQKPGPFVDRFFNRVSSPYLTDIEIDWRGLDVQELSPGRIPDLFTGQPLVVYGRYKDGGRANVRVRGKIGGKSVQFKVPVHLPKHSDKHDTIATVWARKMIERLETNLLNRHQRDDQVGIVKEITQLALDYRLMSQYTAFVAVEEVLRRNAEGKLERVVQPVELPDGTSRSSILGDEGNYGSGASPASKPKRARSYARFYSRRGLGASGSGSGGGGLGRGIGSSSATSPGSPVVGQSSGTLSSPDTAVRAEESKEICVLERRVRPSGLHFKLASLQGGQSKDRAYLTRWLKRALGSQAQCVSRRTEESETTLKVELVIEKDGKIAGVHIRDRGGVHNLTIRCLLFALRGKVSGNLRAGTYKLALRLSK